MSENKDTELAQSAADGAESTLPKGYSRLHISGEIITQATSAYPEEHRDLIRWLFGHAKEQNFGLKEIGAAMKIDPSTIYKVFFGKYINADGKQVPLNKLCEVIKSYKELYEERHCFHHAGFVQTSIATSIFEACTFSLISQMPVFIYGESQIGKTFALEEYRRQHNHGQTVLIRMPANPCMRLVIDDICRECYINANSNFNTLRGKVLRSIDSSKLVIVDEVHQCFIGVNREKRMQVVELLREIYDRTRCGMVLCGTKVLKEEVWHGKFKEIVNQFRRRGVTEVDLPSVAPRKDINAIARAFRLEQPEGEAAQLIKVIIADHGLGKFVKYLEAASRMAEKRGQKLSWHHFIATHDLLVRLSIGSQKED